MSKSRILSKYDNIAKGISLSKDDEHPQKSIGNLRFFFQLKDLD